MAARRSSNQRPVSIARLGRRKVYEVSESELERFEAEGERLKAVLQDKFT
jgi:hypothetical protein